MPIAKVQMPDGRIGKFEVPEGTTPEQVLSFARQMPQASSSDPTEGMSGTEKFLAGAGKGFVDIGRGVNQMTAGSALGGAGLDEQGRPVDEPARRFYESEAERGQAIQEEINESRRLDAPLLKTTSGFSGNIAGNIAAVAPLAFVPGAGTLAGASLIGSSLSAVQPTSENESRLSNTLIGAGTGALGFGAGKALGAGISAVKRKIADFTARKAAAPKQIPELDELRVLADKAYTKAENAGLLVSKKSFGNTVRDIRKKVLDEGIDPNLHPRATAALKRLEGSNKKMSLKEIDTLRRVVKAASSSIEPDERRVARIMLDKLDDYVSSLTPKDVISGKGKVFEATAALTSARALWTRFRKGEAIEDLIKRAKNRSSQFSGSGYENALRTEFRNLLQNKKRLRVFNQKEQEAIAKVAKGGPIGNILRFIGKFSPSGGLIPTVLSGSAGYAVGGPVGSAVLMGAGGAGKLGSRMITARNARMASELMRSGDSLPQRLPPITNNKLLANPAVPQSLGLLAPSIYASQQ